MSSQHHGGPVTHGCVPERSVQTQDLIRFLVDTVEDQKTRGVRETIYYTQMADACGLSVEKTKQRLQATVKKVLCEEYTITLTPTGGKGMVYAFPEEAAQLGGQAISEIHNKSKWTIKRMVAARGTAPLSAEQQLDYDAKMSGVGIIRMCGNAKAQKQLEGAVAVKRAQLEVGDFLRLFDSKNGE